MTGKSKNESKGKRARGRDSDYFRMAEQSCGKGKAWGVGEDSLAAGGAGGARRFRAIRTRLAAANFLDRVDGLVLRFVVGAG